MINERRKVIHLPLEGGQSELNPGCDLGQVSKQRRTENDFNDCFQLLVNGYHSAEECFADMMISRGL